LDNKAIAVVLLIAAAAAWYWSSPWPVALAAVLLAWAASDVARGALRHSAALWALTRSPRPMQMHWTFSVMFTDRAWDAIGVPAEERPDLQQRLGEYDERFKGFSFEDRPTPTWMSQRVSVSYERWGESLERWTIYNSWGKDGFSDPPQHHEKRVLQYLPMLDEVDIIRVWGDWDGFLLRFEKGRLICLYRDSDTSIMPNGHLYIKNPTKVLFNLPAPTLRRGTWWGDEDVDPLARFSAPPDKDVDFGYMGRHPGNERFVCEDWIKGYRWEMNIHDLRPCLDGRVVRVRRSLWRRQPLAIVVELVGSGLRLEAQPQVVQPPADGRTLPRKDERVRVVLNSDDGSVDRVWLSNL